MKETLTITIHTRILKRQMSVLNEVLGDVSALFSKAKWTMVSRRNQDIPVEKPAFMKEVGLSSRYYNAVKKEVDGLFQSQQANMQRYIQEATLKIGLFEERQQGVRHAIAECDADREKVPLYAELGGINRRIQQKKNRVAVWKQLIGNGRISACNGSRTLFHKQFNLTENGYSSHEEWQADYRQARSREFVVVGSKDETAGNQLCVISEQENGLYQLRLRLPPALEQQHGKYITIADIGFPHRRETVVSAMESNALRKHFSRDIHNPALVRLHQHNIRQMEERQQQILERMVLRGDPQAEIDRAAASYGHQLERFRKPTANNLLGNFGQAVTYRFVRDEKGWRVFLSVTRDVEISYQTDRSNGAIGIDLNEHHMAVTEVNALGGKVGSHSLCFRLDKHQSSSNQTKTRLSLAIKEVVEQAKVTGKPVVIEKLDFKGKKARLDTGKSKRFNQMLSAFVSSTFLNLLRLRCAEHGVELIMVGAYYTSLIGRLKYNTEHDFNTHQAAAHVIARLGLGLTDRRLPQNAICIIRKTQMIFPVPEDTGKTQVFVYLRKVRSAYDAWFKQTLEEVRKQEEASCLRMENPVFPF